MNIDPSIGMTLHRENEQLRALLQSTVTVIGDVLETNAYRMSESAVDQLDEAVERLKAVLREAQPERKLSDVPLDEYLMS
jgi:uncharacterized protein YktB (UPF0637 family)